MYDKCIIVGFGKAACDCLKISIKYIKNISVIESEYNQLSVLKSVAEKLNIEYNSIYKKRELTNYLLNIDEKCIVISANNKYIFPTQVVNKSNLTIINFHNSLLPYYRGMNDPSWVIYNSESITGITWHFVNENIDEGRIIIQKKFMLTGNERAIDVIRKCIYLGTEAFEEIAEDLFRERIIGIKQDNTVEPKLYYSYQVPNNGKISVEDNFQVIYSTLRSTDYGGMPFFKPVEICLFGKKYYVKKYSVNDIDSNDYIFYSGNELNIICSNKHLCIYLQGDEV